jgi:hypothetical protein
VFFFLRGFDSGVKLAVDVLEEKPPLDDSGGRIHVDSAL